MLDHAGRVLDAREVDHDLVVALLADLRLRDAEPIDAVAEDLDRAVEVGLLQRAVRRRHRLQRHLEPALQVEAERRLVVERRCGNHEQRDADQPGDDQPNENEVGSAIHAVSRLAAFSLISYEFFMRFLGVDHSAATPRRTTLTFVPGAISTSSVSSVSSIDLDPAEQAAQRDDLVADGDRLVQRALLLGATPLRPDHEQPEADEQRDENDQPSWFQGSSCGPPASRASAAAV